jgi:outer membrane protein
MKMGTEKYRLINIFLILLFALLFFGAKPRKDGNENSDSVKNTALPTDDSGSEDGEFPEIFQNGVLTLTVKDAVLLSLENNGSLSVERLKTSIEKTYENEERGAFDPILSGDLAYSSGDGTTGTTSSEKGSVEAGVSFPFPTGTEFGGTLSIAKSDEASLGVSVDLSQELLKDRRKAANLANVKKAELDSIFSEFELRGFTETLVSSVESVYWDFFSAELKVEIYTEGVRIAEQQLAEIRERISVGSIPAIELVAAQAERALRRETLLNAQALLEGERLKLLHFLNFPGENLWETEIVTKERPAIPSGGIDDLNEHLASALRMRPDLNQALLTRKRGEIDVVLTKNGLLPRLELFISLGKTGYSESFSGAASNLVEDGFDLDASLTFSYPVGNRQARAKNERAFLTSRQAEIALDNLKRLIELDVRSAFIEVQRTSEQIDATAISRTLQEEKLRAEMEKFRVGRSTALLVAQSQRDLLDSRIAEQEALIDHLKALINLYRLDGSLLLRRGITVAGRLTVEDSALLPDQ